MRLLLVALPAVLVACSGSSSVDVAPAASDIVETTPGPTPNAAPKAEEDAGASDAGDDDPGPLLPPTPDGGPGDTDVVFTLAKVAHPIDLTDPNGFTPQARLSADGKSIEVRAWVTPPNTHDAGYSVEESVLVRVPLKVGTFDCTRGGAEWMHSRLYDQSPPGAPVYNPFEAYATKAVAAACTVSTTKLDATSIEGKASGTLTRTKNVNGTLPAQLAFTIAFRVPRR